MVQFRRDYHKNTLPINASRFELMWAAQIMIAISNRKVNLTRKLAIPRLLKAYANQLDASVDPTWPYCLP